MCLKGRQNYLCLHRWYQYRSNPQLSLVAEPWIAKIDRWLETTSSGDRAELSWLGEHSAIWARISGNSSRCLGGDCPEGAECFINRIRREAGRCRLLIVNHHLFFSDLALKAAGHGEVLPRSLIVPSSSPARKICWARACLRSLSARRGRTKPRKRRLRRRARTRCRSFRG